MALWSKNLIPILYTFASILKKPLYTKKIPASFLNDVRDDILDFNVWR